MKFFFSTAGNGGKKKKETISGPPMNHRVIPCFSGDEFSLPVAENIFHAHPVCARSRAELDSHSVRLEILHLHK